MTMFNREQEEEMMEEPITMEELVNLAPTRKNRMGNLFEVPQPEDNDMYTDDLFELPGENMEYEDDLSDLTTVTKEDIMGRVPVRKPKLSQRLQRTNKPYYPPTSLGGMR